MVHVTASIVVHVTQLLFAVESFLHNNDYYLKMNDFLYIVLIHVWWPTDPAAVTSGPIKNIKNF